jgi:hypothetical protein
MKPIEDIEQKVEDTLALAEQVAWVEPSPFLQRKILNRLAENTSQRPSRSISPVWYVAACLFLALNLFSVYWHLRPESNGLQDLQSTYHLNEATNLYATSP